MSNIKNTPRPSTNAGQYGLHNNAPSANAMATT